MTTSTALPTAVSATTRDRSFGSLMSLPSNLIDDVAGLDAGGFCGALLLDAGDQRAARGLDVEALGDLVGDLLDADAEPAAAKLAELTQRIHHADDGLGGHRKADADRAARGRDDQRVDADDLAVEIEQRAAGIAAVDRGVGLDVAVIGSGIDVAVARRDDAGGDGAAKAERIADRDHPFAKPQLVGIAEFHRDQRFRRRREFQHRQIGLLVDPDQRRLDLGAVVHDEVDFVGIGNDVIVGHGDARGIDDEAGAERVGLARLHPAAALVASRPAAAVLEEIVEKFLERRARGQLRHGATIPAATAGLGLDRLGRRNIDDRIDHLLGDVGDAVGASRKRRHGKQGGCGAKADGRCPSAWKRARRRWLKAGIAPVMFGLSPGKGAEI